MTIKLNSIARTIAITALAVVTSLTPALRAHESPIDHVDRILQIYIEAGRIHVIYRFRCEERQVMLQLNQMDRNRDGKISDEERDAWFGAVADRLAKQLHIELDGRDLSLTCDGPVKLAPDLSQTYELSAAVGDLTTGSHHGKFSDDYSRIHPGPYRWRPRQINRNGIDVEAVAAPGLEVIGPHPAMIIVNLDVTVGLIPTSVPTTTK